MLAFPGQGGDWQSALATLQADADHPLVAHLAGRLGTNAWERLDPHDTRHAQPVIFAAGLLGIAARLRPGSEVAMVVGHSLGEITAAAWSGALDPQAGIDLLVERAELAHQAQLQRPGAMASVMRWDRVQVDGLRAEIETDGDGELTVAVVNSPTQHVLSGDAAAVERAVKLANERGGVARALAIGGAFHSPLMASAMGSFRSSVERAGIEAPAVPLIPSTTGLVTVDGAELAEALVASLARPVDWPEAIRTASRAGAQVGIDAGPGDTIVRLARFLPELPFTATDGLDPR